jgi:SAM-dependent methyltransferase
VYVDPYQSVADLYEAEYGALDSDVEYFARHGTRGPLLVLGCGTGRIGRRLARTRPVTGLDVSAPMLAVARQKAPDARYVEADMRTFDLGAFSEIVAPNGAFNFLATRADQHACLACCQRTLVPGGALTLDLPMPSFALLGTPHSPERLAWEGTLDGRAVRRTRETHRSPVRQRLELVDRYYVDGALIAASPLVLRLIFPSEVEWMLEAAGFAVEALHGDYGDAPLTESSPRLLVRAVRL